MFVSMVRFYFVFIYSRTSLIRTPTDPAKNCSAYPEFILTEVISIENTL